jgi:hypothetical protein
VGLTAVLTPGILVLVIAESCILVPVLIACEEKWSDKPARGGKGFRVFSAFLAGLPMLAIIGWDALGIPPSHGTWLTYTLFVLAGIMPLVALGIDQALYGHGCFLAALAFLLYLSLLIAQMVAPPIYMLHDIHSFKSDVTAVSPHVPDPCDSSGAQPLFAHISDLHITEKSKTRDGHAPGNKKLPAIIARIKELKPPYLLISGDITDEGTAAQWQKVEELLNGVGPKTQVFMSTGNHDLNQFFGQDPEEHPSMWSQSHKLSAIKPRIFLAAEFQARNMPEVKTSAGQTLSDFITHVPTAATAAQFKTERDECALSCIADAPPELRFPGPACRAICETDLDSLRYHYFHDLPKSFPLYYIDETAHTAFFSMTTSLSDTDELGRNAIGSSGADQIQHLRALLANLPADIRYIVIVQHHPPLWEGVPAFPVFHWADLGHWRETKEAFYTSAWFLAVFLHHDIEDARETYGVVQAELAKRPGVSALFAFGHRHHRSLVSIGAVTLEEAPNLATTDQNDRGFYLVGTKNDRLDVSWCPLQQP